MGKSNNHKTSKSTVAPQAEVKNVENSIEHSKYVYEQVNRWIEDADNKVNVSFGIFTGVFGIFTFLANRYVFAPDNPVINESWHLVYRWSFYLSLFVMAIAFAFYTRAIIPNLKSNEKNKQTQKKYPLYFGDIHSLKFEDYQKLMERASDKDFNDELIHECWYNANICLKKMRLYKAGVIASIVAIGVAAVSFVAQFLMYR